MSDGTEIRVNIESLNDMAHTVHEVADGVTRPALEQANGTFGLGVRFGGRASFASSDILDARIKYRECMQAALDTTAGLARTVEAVAGAAELVAEAYGQTDALAAGRQSHVEAALGHATILLYQAAEEAAAAAQQREQEFLGQHSGLV